METLVPAARRLKKNYTNWTDAQLVVAALLSDLRAFDELTQRYRVAVIATATLIVSSRQTAEDLAQDVFLTAFYALPQLDDPARFGGWLRVITKRKAWRYRTQEKVKSGSDMPLLEDYLDAPLAPDDNEPEAVLAQKEEREILLAALKLLPHDQRELILLYAYEDWPLARIAQYLFIEEGTARVRLFRARQALRRIQDSLCGEQIKVSEKNETTPMIRTSEK